MEAIVLGPYPLLSVSCQETCIIPSFWKIGKVFKFSEIENNSILENKTRKMGTQ